MGASVFEHSQNEIVLDDVCWQIGVKVFMGEEASPGVSVDVRKWLRFKVQVLVFGREQFSPPSEGSKMYMWMCLETVVLYICIKVSGVAAMAVERVTVVD